MSELEDRLKFARTLVIGLATAPDDKLQSARDAIENSPDLNYEMKRAVIRLIDAILATGSNAQARTALVGQFLNALDELAAEERKKKKPCFIATAACGTAAHDDVRVLRDFRDEVLRPNFLGRSFIRLYEFFSPPLAALIAVRPWARRVVRGLVVSPARRVAGRFLRAG
jgi:hypothetical protein